MLPSITAWRPGTASAVDLEAGHLDGQPGVKRRHSAQRRRLAVGIALSQQHIVDRVVRQSGALQQRGQDGRGQLGGGHIAEHAAEPADRRP